MNPPRHCAHPQPLGLGLPFRRQVSPSIATAQVLAVDKGLAALDHCQVDRALADHLRHRAGITIHRLNPQAHCGSERKQGLELVATGHPIGALGRLGRIDTGQPHIELLAPLQHADRVAIADRKHRGSRCRLGEGVKGSQGEARQA